MPPLLAESPRAAGQRGQYGSIRSRPRKLMATVVHVFAPAQLPDPGTASVAEDALDLLEESLGQAGLYEVRIHAGSDRSLLRSVERVGTQGNDGDLPGYGMRFDHSDRFPTIHLWQPEVHHDDV